MPCIMHVRMHMRMHVGGCGVDFEEVWALRMGVEYCLPLAVSLPPSTNHHVSDDPAAQEGCGLGEQRVRISFPGTTDHVREAMRRLSEWWASDKGGRFRNGMRSDVR